MITIDRLKQLLHYDPETGHWRWLVNRAGTAKAGSLAGKQNNNGYLDKVEQDRIDGVIGRARKFHHGYVSAQKALRETEVEYQSNGVARLYCDKWALTGMTSLKAFRQTGWSYYNHYSGNPGMYITSVIGDRCYIEINLKHSASP